MAAENSVTAAAMITVRRMMSKFAGRVTAASFLGAANRVTVETNGARVAAMLPASITVPAEGETVTLSFLPQDLHTMDGAQ